MDDYDHLNQIIWQKWADPFGQDDIEEARDIINNFNNNEDEEDDEADKSDKIINSQYVKVMATPMGIIPINENTASNKIFNFWMGHTNFDITKKIVSIIEESQGVESLDVFTRYRFRIAVGKAFNDSVVMRNINEEVYSYLDTK